MQPGLSCLLLHISCLFKAVSPLSFPVDEDQAPFYSSWKSERAREQEIKRNAKDIDKRRSERERKRWEMETGERGEQSACEREQEWERRCEGDVCKCVRIEERGAREWHPEERRSSREEWARFLPRAFPCVNYTRKAYYNPARTPADWENEGGRLERLSSARLSHRLKIIVSLLHVHRPR